MNNTQQEYSAEDLNAIALSKRVSLYGNTATPAAIARFAREWDKRSAVCTAQAALRTVTGTLSDYFQDLDADAVSRTADGTEWAAVPLKMLRQLHVAVQLAETTGHVITADPRDAVAAVHHDGNLLLREDGYPHVTSADVQPGSVVVLPPECDCEGQQHAEQPLPLLAKIGQFSPDLGGIYAGIMSDSDKPDYHLILLPGQQIDVDYAMAEDWSGMVGGSIPTDREALLLGINCPDIMDPAGYYWTSDQCDIYPGMNQVVHDFETNSNSVVNKADFYKACAVRRIPV